MKEAPDVSYRANEYVSGSPGNVGGGSTFPKPGYGATETFSALRLNESYLNYAGKCPASIRTFFFDKYCERILI